MQLSTRRGLTDAIACKPSSYARFLSCASPGLFPVALPRPPARLASCVVAYASPLSRFNVVSIHALDPDFYKIPYVEGIPVGKRLKLWNLPPNCKHSELLEWFSGVDVVVESLELTDDPTLKAQGIGGFVEFATKQHACIAIVRLDGYKFRGHYIRMDFAEKRPRPRDYGSRRRRPNQYNSSGGSFSTFPSRMPIHGSTNSAKSTPRDSDHDKDGKLNFTEFQDGVYDLIKPHDEEDVSHSSSNLDSSARRESHAKWRFSDLDKTKDGFLTEDELIPIIDNLHPEYLISQADSTKDGHVTIEEILENPYIFYSTPYAYEDCEEYYHDEF